MPVKIYTHGQPGEMTSYQFFALLAVIIVATGSVAVHFAHKRTKALQGAALEMGFTFEELGQPFLKELDENLHLLHQAAWLMKGSRLV